MVGIGAWEWVQGTVLQKLPAWVQSHMKCKSMEIPGSDISTKLILSFDGSAQNNDSNVLRDNELCGPIVWWPRRTLCYHHRLLYRSRYSDHTAHSNILPLAVAVSGTALPPAVRILRHRLYLSSLFMVF